MSLQYPRKVSLTVGSASTAYDLSNMRIQFQVVGPIINTLKHAVITVWNLGQSKVNAILKEFTQVTLSAGYQDGPFGVIFTGQIARVEAGKENATDSYVRLYAQDGDGPKRFAMTKVSLASGWTDEDVYNQLMQDFQGAGLQPGYNPGIVIDTTAPRGNPLIGQTSSLMNELASRQNCTWFIEDGKVNLVPIGKTIPGPAPTLSSATGLIGVPKLTLGGVNVRCLLNPNIKNGYAITIDNSQINQLTQQQPFLNDLGVIPSIPGDGKYVVHNVVQTGDTRGNDWYTDMVCVALDGTNQPAFYDAPEAI